MIQLLTWPVSYPSHWWVPPPHAQPGTDTWSRHSDSAVVDRGMCLWPHSVGICVCERLNTMHPPQPALLFLSLPDLKQMKWWTETIQHKAKKVFTRAHYLTGPLKLPSKFNCLLFFFCPSAEIPGSPEARWNFACTTVFLPKMHACVPLPFRQQHADFRGCT